MTQVRQFLSEREREDQVLAVSVTRWEGDPGSCFLQQHPLPVTNISVSRGRGWMGGVSSGG
jgi:hypothetical protein